MKHSFKVFLDPSALFFSWLSLKEVASAHGRCLEDMYRRNSSTVCLDKGEESRVQ